MMLITAGSMVFVIHQICNLRRLAHKISSLYNYRPLTISVMICFLGICTESINL